MRDIVFIEKPIIPLHNQVLIKVEDTYDDKTSKGGIIMHNAASFDAEADSTGYNLSQWIIRSGIVHTMPRELSQQDYDWKPNKGDIKEGDEVFWPIVKFFDYPVLKTDAGDLFLLVNYHDIHLKIVDGKPVPVNGYYLFTQSTRERVIFEYVHEETTGRYRLEIIGDDVEYDYEEFNYGADWKVGDECLLAVPPFKLEAEISQQFEKQYFLAQKRHILMSS